MQPDDGDFWLFDRDSRGGSRDAEPLDYDALGAAYDRIDDVLADAKVLRADVALASRVKLDGDVPAGGNTGGSTAGRRSEEHTSELQSLMRSSYVVFCLK